MQEAVRMRITLVYNPTAGDGTDRDALVQLLEDEGHKVRAASRKGPWRDALKKPTDLVVAVGGDGTFRQVALAVAGTDTPMAILPMGTANNIGKTLELLGDARPVIESWDGGRPQPFDVGAVRAPWGEDQFVESMGGGLFGKLISSPDERGQSPVLLGRATDQSLHRLGEMLLREPTRPWSISIDGEPHDGDYLAVEILNIRFIGPNMPIAPAADPGDGRLDVVLVGADDREKLQDYIEGRLNMAAAELPRLPVKRGGEIELEAPSGVHLHLDDGEWPKREALLENASLSIRVRSGMVKVMRG
jgi:diacylglycerol kinase family enzyme